MRLLLLALVPLAVAAQPAAPPLRFDVGVGIGVAYEDGDGFLATTATASARRGWATAQLRGALAAPVFGSASRWEAAALAGPTWAGPVGRAFVGAGLGLAGGEAGSSSLCIGPGPACSPRDRGRLSPAVGLALAGEGAVRVRSGVWLTLRGDANVNGPRPTAAGTLGVRLGL